jgi:hypothetical protein
MASILGISAFYHDSAAALVVGWCVSHVLLVAVYFLVLTPIGFLLRLFRDPMELRFEREASSYWFPREAVDSGRYFRQL